MRICIVTPEFPHLTPERGGIGAQMATLAPALAEAGLEVHVIAPADPSAETSVGPFEHHPVPRPELGRFFPLADPVFAARVSHTVRSLEHADVVLAPEYGGYARGYARNKRFGPLITSLQTSMEQVLLMNSSIVEGRALRLQHRLQRRAERAQALRSDAILACSHSLLAWTERLWPLAQEHREVLPNVLDVARLRRLAASGNAPTIPGEGPVISFSGRLETRKGVEALVQAMNRVWSEAPEARLALAGRDGLREGGMMSDHLRELAGAHVGSLHFLGGLEPHTLMSLLARSELVVTPSRWEAFGFATFEALALGRPTIATAAGGFADFLETGRDAILVPPDDSLALGEAILGLLHDSARRRALGDAGAKRAAEFDVSNQINRYIAFFEQVAGA